jgi:hypothetical protein
MPRCWSGLARVAVAGLPGACSLVTGRKRYLGWYGKYLGASGGAAAAATC